MTKTPHVNSEGKKQLDKIQEGFDTFQDKVESLTMDNLRKAPKIEREHQVNLSQKEIAKSPDIYLKPIKTIPSREKFNEDFRSEYEFSKQYVYFKAENREIIGEAIDMWTKPFPGLPAEEWKVPVNKPIWAPRYVAEQIKRKCYTKLVMQERPTHQSYEGSYYGDMVAEESVPRLDAHPVSTQKSIFMSAV